MKKIFNLLLAMLAIVGVACTPDGGDNGGNGNGNGNNNGGASASYVIDVTGITSNSATVTVTPSNSDTYYFDVIEKEYLDAYPSEAQFLADYVTEIKDYIDELNAYGYGITFADFVSYGKDSYTYEAGSFDPNTEYYAFAFGLSESGEITSGMTKKVFTTLSNGGNAGGGASTSNNTFKVNVSDITANGALVSVTPSNYDTYYFDVIEKDIYDMYTDKKEFATDYMAEIAEVCKDYGYSIADVLSSGSDAYSFEGYLDPNTAYYAVAFGVSTSGAITTDVAATAFTTLSSGGGNTGGSTGDKNLTCFELGYYENWGDYYESGATNWYIDLYSMTSNDYFVLELQGNLNETAPVAGEYKLLSTFAPGTAVAGGVDSDGYGYGTYWALLDNNWEYFVETSLCTSGTVKVTKSDNLYTIDIDAIGDSGNSIKVSYSGVLEEYISDYSLAAQKLSNNLNKRFCTVSRMMKQKQVKMAPKAMLKKASHSTMKFAPKKVAPKSALIKRDLAR